MKQEEIDRLEVTYRELQKVVIEIGFQLFQAREALEKNNINKKRRKRNG